MYTNTEFITEKNQLINETELTIGNNSCENGIALTLVCLMGSWGLYGDPHRIEVVKEATLFCTGILKIPVSSSI